MFCAILANTRNLQIRERIAAKCDNPYCTSVICRAALQHDRGNNLALKQPHTSFETDISSIRRPNGKADNYLNLFTNLCSYYCMQFKNYLAKIRKSQQISQSIMQPPQPTSKPLKSPQPSQEVPQSPAHLDENTIVTPHCKVTFFHC